jgi:AraC-like DNA-binding protein
MNDFASAAMLRVMHAGMRRLHIDSPAQQWLRTATIPLDAKRQLVGSVLAQRGVGALVQLGQGVHDITEDSTLPLLVHLGHPLRMLQAWLRLERFVHSRHRLQQTLVNACTVEHRHVSLVKDTRPSPAEDLVVLGVLIGLLERCACSQVQARLECGRVVWPLADAASLAGLGNAYAQGTTSAWCLSWQMPEAGLQPVPATPSAQLASVYQQAVAWLKEQGEQTVTIDQLAQHMGFNVRTLQRKFTLEGTRFVDVVAKVRTERASQLLTHSPMALAQVGFACGYTDQAHFCRDFKRHVGLSPQQFRQQSQHKPTKLSLWKA